MNKKLLSKQDVSEMIGISQSKINKDMVNGLPYIKVGTLVKFKLEDVEKFYIKKAENNEH